MHRVKCIRLRDGGKTCLKYVESSIIDTKTNINRPKTHDFRWISSLNRLTLRPNCLEGAVGVINGNINEVVKGSLGGETSVLRTFRMSGKELVKERVSQRNS